MKEGWGLFFLLVLAQIALTAGISHFPFFLKPGRKRLSPLSFIRRVGEGLRIAPAHDHGVGAAPLREPGGPNGGGAVAPQGSGVIFSEGRVLGR